MSRERFNETYSLDVLGLASQNWKDFENGKKLCDHKISSLERIGSGTCTFRANCDLCGAEFVVADRYGRIAQKVELAAHNGMVTGSSPVAPTKQRKE